jgi:hypothetical protein
MSPLSASQLLDLADQGRRAAMPSRAVMIIASACPYMADDEIVALTLSDRDRLLLKIRRQTFGLPLIARQQCGQCDDLYELQINPDDIGLGDAAEMPPPHNMVQLAGSRHMVRALTLDDMIAVEGESDPARIKTLLANRILPGLEIQAAALSAALEIADPHADISCEAACPSCGQTQQLYLDVTAFFWEEICNKQPRILREVAELAHIYHWSERDILALSAQRRTAYLELAQ